MERVRPSIATLLAAVLATGGIGTAAEPPPDEQVLLLVRSLSAPEFAVRLRAEQQLLELGPAVLPVLRNAAGASDLEARYRLARLIDALEDAQREVALDAFRAGGVPLDPRLHTAWNIFTNQVGDRREARELFAEMVRCEPWLVNAVAGPLEQLRLEFERRCADVNLQRVQRQESRRSVATVAALLFAAGLPDCHPSATASSCITACIQEGDFLAAMQRPDRPEPLERLVALWISHPDTATAVQRLQLGAKFDLPEGVDVALEIIRQRLGGPQIQHAILYLAKAGSPAHLHELELLLSDATDLQVRRQGMVTAFSSKVQDVALAALLHLTGQDPRSYGFSELREHPQYLYAPGTIGFDSQAQRRAALDQWKRWSSEHLKDVQPIVEQAAAGYST